MPDTIITPPTTVDSFVASLRDKVYPVGSVWISTSSTSPASIIGGEWIRFSDGRALTGVSDSDTDFSIGKEGGEKRSMIARINEEEFNKVPADQREEYKKSHEQHSLNATMAMDSAGKIWFTQTGMDYPVDAGVGTKSSIVNLKYDWNTAFGGFGTGKTGAGPRIYGRISVNKLQPYATAYMWRRVA